MVDQKNFLCQNMLFSYYSCRLFHLVSEARQGRKERIFWFRDPMPRPTTTSTRSEFRNDSPTAKTKCRKVAGRLGSLRGGYINPEYCSNSILVVSNETCGLHAAIDHNPIHNMPFLPYVIAQINHCETDIRMITSVWLDWTNTNELFLRYLEWRRHQLSCLNNLSP